MELETRYPRRLKNQIARAIHVETPHNESRGLASQQLIEAAIKDAAWSNPTAAGIEADEKQCTDTAPRQGDFAPPLPPPATDVLRAPCFGGFEGTPAPPWHRPPQFLPPGAVLDPKWARRPRARRNVHRPWPLAPNETARMPDACAILGLSEGSIRNRYNPKSPYFSATFPRPKRLGSGGSGKCRGAIGWRAGDLYAWRDAQLE